MQAYNLWKSIRKSDRLERIYIVFSGLRHNWPWNRSQDSNWLDLWKTKTIFSIGHWHHWNQNGCKFWYNRLFQWFYYWKSIVQSIKRQYNLLLQPWNLFSDLVLLNWTWFLSSRCLYCTMAKDSGSRWSLAGDPHNYKEVGWIFNKNNKSSSVSTPQNIANRLLWNSLKPGGLQ